MAPLNGAQETHHFVSTDFLGRMKYGSLLVNISRGPIVDTEALVERVKAGAIRAALAAGVVTPRDVQHSGSFPGSLSLHTLAATPGPWPGEWTA